MFSAFSWFASVTDYSVAAITYIAISAAVLIAYAVVFCVALFRRKHRRNAFDVVLIVFGSLVLLCTLVLALFAVIVRFEPFKISAEITGNKTAILYNGKTLFSVPFVNAVTELTQELELIAVVAPAVVFAVCLFALITLGVKTRMKIKAEQIESADVRTEADKSESDATESDVLNTEQENESPEVDETKVAASEPATETDEQTPEQAEISPDSARTIFDEINELVTGYDGAVAEETDKIDKELKRAIEEGYELFDSINSSGEPIAKETEDKAEEPEESEEVEEPEKSEENFEEEETPEQAPEKEIFVSPEILTQRRVIKSDKKVIAVEEAENIPPEREHSSLFGDDRKVAKVRTIVRRPAAKNIADIEKRAEELLGEAGVNAFESDSDERKSPRAKKKAEVKTLAENKEPKQEKKSVVAEEGGLPLTRKYIILNRRNAAAMFNDYLNSKRASEKEELTDSLNTIIMK